jgi:YVTN family beta-propeller protein
VTPDGNYVYIPNQGNNRVAVIETASNTVATIPVAGPSAISILSPPSQNGLLAGKRPLGIQGLRFKPSLRSSIESTIATNCEKADDKLWLSDEHRYCEASVTGA